MLSDKAKRELLGAGASLDLREDFRKMTANVRQAGAAMSLDELLAFLTAADAMFAAPRQPPVHVPYPRALI